MRKLTSAVLLCVFALSFITAVSTTLAEPAASSVCKATCDFDVNRLWVCCPYTVGNGGHVKWDCYYGAPCGILY